MKNLAICAMVLGSMIAASHDAEASHRLSLYQAADDYRDAVREFERQVLRLHYIERCDKRLVDDLEDQTSRLRSAARHPELSSRFAEAWFETQSLQSQVEAALFGRACYPRNFALEQCWQAVVYRFSIMAAQVQCLQVHPSTTHPLMNPTVYPSPYPSLFIPVPTTVYRQSFPTPESVDDTHQHRQLGPTLRSLDVSSHHKSQELLARREAMSVGGLGLSNSRFAKPAMVVPTFRSPIPAAIRAPSFSRPSLSIGANLTR